MLSSCSDTTDPSLSARLEAHAGAAEREFVAVGQLLLADPYAVDPRAVGRAEVDDDESVALRANLRVVAAHVGVSQHDVGFGHASHGDRLFPEDDAFTRREDEAAGATAADALAHAAFDLERPRVHAIVDDELDLDRAEERVALVAGVLAGGIAQLADEGLVETAEPLVVVGADL